VEYPDLAVA
jgi:cholesterol oxidase